MAINTIPQQWVFSNQFEDLTGATPYRLNTTGGNTGGTPGLLPTTDPDFQEITGAGVKTTDSDVFSLSIIFDGTGGSLNSVSVPDGFEASYPAQSNGGFLDTIDFIVPTAGGAKVLIAYTK